MIAYATITGMISKAHNNGDETAKVLDSIHEMGTAIYIQAVSYQIATDSDPDMLAQLAKDSLNAAIAYYEALGIATVID